MTPERMEQAKNWMIFGFFLDRRDRNKKAETAKNVTVAEQWKNHLFHFCFSLVTCSRRNEGFTYSNVTLFLFYSCLIFCYCFKYRWSMPKRTFWNAIGDSGCFLLLLFLLIWEQSDEKSSETAATMWFLFVSRLFHCYQFIQLFGLRLKVYKINLNW